MDITGVLTGLGFTGVFTGVAVVLGGLLIVAGLLAVALTGVGIVLALLFFKTRQIVIPGATLFILNLVEAPIRYILWMFGIEEDIVGRMIIEVRNVLYRDRYQRTPYAQRALFLPQCLRSPKCPAPLTPEGIRCLNCGLCGIGKVKEEAEQLGYKVFIAPGSSLIKRMVKQYRPKAVLGVGCPMEVKEGTAKMASYGLPVQGVVLERDGCVDTRVDAVELLEKIKSHHDAGAYHIGKDLEYLKKAAGIAEMWRENELAGVEIVPAKRQSTKEKW
jgi:uncharacterized protein